MDSQGNQLKGMVGGEGTSDWGMKTFGPGESQHAAPGQGNLLATKGGRRRRGKGKGKTRKGGYGMTQVLVPAALFAANYAYGKRGSMRLPKMGLPKMGLSKRRSSRRFRRGSRRFRR